MAIRHHIKILVVDDEVGVCNTVSLILKEHGYYVDAFTSPAQALKAAQEQPYDIALIDLKMPEMSGVEVVEKLGEIDSRVSPIVMTAYPDVESAAETMRLGGRDYITKPFREEQLLASVGRVCQKMGLIYTSESELNRLIGQRIRQERQAQKLTLRQLSERAELTTSQLSQVELGKNAASLWALARISNSLGKQISEILAGL